jgi:hypothetical protein
VRAYKDHDDLLWMCPPDDLGFDVDAYVAQQVAKTLVPYAIIHDGQWLARGTMGWFACSYDEQDGWEAKATALLRSLPPETLLTLVDCHI